MKTVKQKKEKGAGREENILSLYLKEIGNIPVLSKEEEEKTTQAMAAGDMKARERLLRGNLRFVVSIAKKYRGLGMPFEDLISEGNVGLAIAADRFDPKKGWRFISYAVWWIRQTIFSAICEKSRLIRLPQNRALELVKIEQAKKLLSAQQSPENELNAIADILHMEKEHVSDLVNISKELVSLEKTVSAEDGTQLGDLLEDRLHESPEDFAMQAALKTNIEELLKTLSKDEAFIIRSHFGIGGCPVMSLKEIGESLHISKERVRQIEVKILNRLAKPLKNKKLHSFVA
ncbi:MAG: RNA polymerase sigma factor RpoD/SigA [Spirochaetes bacterium]|nr:RNA polymerase sigma factor RpoD/SigA [Spirochaetota bacterium]